MLNSRDTVEDISEIYTEIHELLALPGSPCSDVSIPLLEQAMKYLVRQTGNPHEPPHAFKQSRGIKTSGRYVQPDEGV
jgi:hypothetical protein